MKNKLINIIPWILIGIIAGFLLGKVVSKTNTSNGVKTSSSSKQTNNRTHQLQPEPSGYAQSNTIPEKAYKVWQHVKSHHEAMSGYVGGREFKNREQQLEKNRANGEKIKYQEWDVNPKIEHQNRGTERLITSDDERAWYTSNHYKTFTQLKP
jgi:ribonuclease T1